MMKRLLVYRDDETFQVYLLEERYKNLAEACRYTYVGHYFLETKEVDNNKGERLADQ